ncbi:hypothetical protein QYE76_006161 [Lolium multiflorum]|uniref:Integrase catalytic domain-containing protein n=1 Tax=Lolium multiflorum TaxID=4521 RepID=A0AAD8W445_LOLMU|nr:hypothetical protein QYE76_006161 [Lolium multiflorum]
MAVKMAVETAVEMTPGQFPVPGRRNRDFCPPNWSFAMAAALEATKALSGTTPSHAYTPQQNGVVERMNRTIISKARCMLSNVGMHRRFWAKASSTACYLINSSPCIPLDKKTPIEQTNSSTAADRPRRNKGSHPRLIEECNLVHHALSCAEHVEHDTEPATYVEAVASVDRVKWIAAMQEEMQSLDKNGTWDVVRLPKQKKDVRSLECPNTDEDIEYMSRVSYSSDVGSLMYIRGTSKACLKFGKTGERLTGYVDSDFAADLDKRRFLTAETEYMAIAEACKESILLKGLYAKLCGDDSCINLFSDSQSAIYLTKDQMFHERTKHIDIKYHYVHDIVTQEGAQFKFIDEEARIIAADDYDSSFDDSDDAIDEEKVTSFHCQ